MKLRPFFTGLIVAALTPWAFAEPLAWDAPDIRDGTCSNSPPALQYPAILITILASLDGGLVSYMPLGNAAYYRWVHQKVNGGVAATDPAQLLLTKPRLRFPNLFSLINQAVGKVFVYNYPSTNKWYELQPLPKINKPFLTDLNIKVINASSGSAPAGFGGEVIPSRFVWADATAVIEWHCFAGDVQVVNVISSEPTLTSAQISSISDFLAPYGFQSQNLMTMPY